MIVGDLLDKEFKRKIFTCHGVSCGDAKASCARSMLFYQDETNKQKFLSLGGCTSVNELEAKREDLSQVKTKTNTYAELGQFVDEQQPKSTADNRLIIPRSFAVSEMAYFFSQIFLALDIPVEVDNVTASDVIAAQPNFNIDVCAPLIGATGQHTRLAKSQHGLILAPQIDYLFTADASLGKTCTT